MRLTAARFYLTMITTAQLESTVRHLLGIFPERRAELQPLLDRIRTSPAPTLTDRTHAEGHLTVSGTVLHVRTGSVLLLRHRALGLWIPPGGHIEPSDDSLPAAAAREVCEETGICGKVLHPVCMSAGRQMALDFDVFPVPANARRGEAAHRHYNLRYVFLYDGPQEVSITPEESLDYRWYPLDDPYVRQLYARIFSRLRQLVPAF